MKDNSKLGSSDSLIAAVRSIMEKEHTVPKGDKEKKLAALAHPKDKITHKDVLVGRGVLKKENSGERMGTIVATRKEKVELEPKLKEEEVKLDEIDSHTADDYRREKRYNSPEQKAKREKEQQHRLKSISPELRRKLKLPEPKKTNEEVDQVDERADEHGYSLHKAAHKRVRGQTGGFDEPVAATKMTYTVKQHGKKVGEIHKHRDTYEPTAMYTGHLHGKKIPYSRTDGHGVHALMKDIVGSKWHAKHAPKVTKEEVDQVDERKLTGTETDKKEKYVMSLKKKMGGFKKRYGERAKEVMYATATKMAKEETVPVQEISTGLASRYLKKTDPETSSPKEVEKRKAGRALALTKKWGGKVGGTAAPKVPTKD